MPNVVLGPAFWGIFLVSLGVTLDSAESHFAETPFTGVSHHPRKGRLESKKIPILLVAPCRDMGILFGESKST